ncbi:MAG: hypothetical protein Q9M24_06115 [Mariprofundaceae bacterium]|nr:hypothetical protein [Mariprofundaceae bacterium]
MVKIGIEGVPGTQYLINQSRACYKRMLRRTLRAKPTILPGGTRRGANSSHASDLILIPYSQNKENRLVIPPRAFLGFFDMNGKGGLAFLSAGWRLGY